MECNLKNYAMKFSFQILSKIDPDIEQNIEILKSFFIHKN